jgi:hypothetical protein
MFCFPRSTNLQTSNTCEGQPFHKPVNSSNRCYRTPARHRHDQSEQSKPTVPSNMPSSVKRSCKAKPQNNPCETFHIQAVDDKHCANSCNQASPIAATYRATFTRLICVGPTPTSADLPAPSSLFPSQAGAAKQPATNTPVQPRCMEKHTEQGQEFCDEIDHKGRPAQH